MIARVVIGDLGGGSIGMRSSLPGYDVLTRGPSDDTQFLSFSSNWTSSLKVLQTGVGVVGSQQGPLLTTIPYPSQGYYPVTEMRRLSGSTVYDDLNVRHASGLTLTGYANYLRNAWVSLDRIGVEALTGDGEFDQGITSIVYAIYKAPL